MGVAATAVPTVSQVLLDTSAFYRLTLAELEAIAARAAVVVSPVSLAEILCHLDDPRHRDEGSGRAATVRWDRICKCDLVRVLCEPFAERQPFAELCAALEGPGHAEVPKEVAERVRGAMQDARRAHARCGRDFCEHLVAALGVEKALSLAGREFVCVAAEGVGALAGRCVEPGVEAAALEGVLFSSLYPFAGFRLARAQDQLKRRSAREWAAGPDDMEDELLCRHLDLLESRALVTADPEARSALNRALAELAAASAEVGAEVVALTRAMSVDEVLRAFPADEAR